jgi:osmotically-inducible protein OsmY
MSTRQHLSPLVAALVATLALGACGRHDEQAARQKVDRTVAKAEQAAETAGAKAATVVNDATITTTITAELARDAALDPTKIDVDTAQGRVVLRGSAPDEQAKERAKRIALAVNGVRGVDNYLTVDNKG